MAISDFYPFKPGQIVTADQWNELFEAIRNGTFMLDNTAIGGIVSRIESLEQAYQYLNQIKSRIYKKEYFIMQQSQTFFTLSFVPMIDSEMVFQNGILLTRKGVMPDYPGDYYIENARNIIFTPEFMADTGIEEGDEIMVSYIYEVQL